MQTLDAYAAFTSNKTGQKTRGPNVCQIAVRHSLVVQCVSVSVCALHRAIDGTRVIRL